MAESTFINMPALDVVRANQDHFTLKVTGLEGQTLQVIGFAGFEHGLSQDYHFTVEFEVTNPLLSKDLLGSSAQLAMAWDVQQVYLNGPICEVKHLGKRVDRDAYQLVIASPLFPLSFNIQSRVYLNKNVTEIIQDVLGGAGLKSTDYTLKTRASYPRREFTVQYNESDLDFILRLMAHDGIFFSFAQTDKQAVLLIHDSVDDLPMLEGGGELLYQAQTSQVRQVETVFAFRQQGLLHTEYVRLKDYNYRTPEAGLLAESRMSGKLKAQGIEYRHGENFKSLDDGDRLGKLRQELLDWQRETFIAESDCRGLMPGQKFSLVGHPLHEFNGDYLVLEVEHHADQRAGQAYAGKNLGMTYRNKSLLIRAGIPYRSKLPNVMQAPGIFTAKIETTGGDYAYLDDQGRYRLRLPFDLSATQAGEASHPVRLMQPYTGNHYGMHFPLHAGTEVVVVCANGDLDRPIILGVVTNPDTPSTVSAANHSQNILRTWGGNELFMEDRKGLEKVELFTRDKLNILTLDANEEGHYIRLATEAGEMEQYAKKTMLLECGDSQTVQSGNDHQVIVQNAQQLMTKNKDIEMHAATDIKLEAGENILLRAEKEDISLTTGKNMVVDVINNLSVAVHNKNLEMQVTSGNAVIQAAKHITFKGDGGGMIHVGQSGGVIEISTGGDLTVDGKSITVNAPSINIRGNSVGNN